jgi:tetratricopeptide (TPR) repeat protein
MKHTLLLIVFLLLPLMSFSQGVKFEQGSWKDALALAKQTNKPVLLYLYFSDVEVSRSIDENMNKEVFPRETVGDVCNTYFVCYRMDASKKDGLALAKKYGLIKRPAVLVVNADGRLLSNLRSMLIASDFMEGAKKLLLDLKDPKPMTAWEAEFTKNKNNQAFLLEYIAKRNNLGLPINEAFDAYLRLLPANEPMPEQAAKLFQLIAYRLMVTDYAYQYFFAHKTAYFETLAKISGGTPYENFRIFQSAVEYTIDVATLLEDETLLKKAVNAFQQIPYEMGMKQVEECYMDYYQQTNEPEKYIAHARLLVADVLKMLDSEELLMKNNTSYQNLVKRMASETDSARIKSLDRLIKGRPDMERGQLCQKLNGIAWYIFETSSDEAELKEALTWSEKTVQVKPTTSGFLDTNANILYKLGRKEEAIALQKKAVASFAGSPSYTVFSDTLKKMEAGEKTW